MRAWIESPKIPEAIYLLVWHRIICQHPRVYSPSANFPSHFYFPKLENLPGYTNWVCETRRVFNSTDEIFAELLFNENFKFFTFSGLSDPVCTLSLEPLKVPNVLRSFRPFMGHLGERIVSKYSEFEMCKTTVSRRRLEVIRALIYD